MWKIPVTNNHAIVEEAPRGGNPLNHAIASITTNRLFVPSYEPQVFYRYAYTFAERIQPLEPFVTSFFNWDTNTFLLEGFTRLSLLANSNVIDFRYRQILEVTSNQFTIPPKTQIISSLNFRYHFVDVYGLTNSVVILNDPIYNTAIYPNTIAIDFQTVLVAIPTHKVFKVEGRFGNLDAVVFRNEVFSKTTNRTPPNKTFTTHNNHLFLWQIL